MKQPTSVADVLALVTRDPGRPRLTWYGPDGERIELSGAVLANWVSKTTNLLVEEFDAGPGVQVGLDLPAHWRTVVWALAAWRCGACVVVGDGVSAADVVVTDRPEAYPAVDQLVAVALPGLARRFDGELPAGAVDAASAVMTYGDQIGWAPEVDAGEVAVASADGVLHGALVGWAGDGVRAPEGARTLLASGADRTGDVVGVLRAVLGMLARDGSAVLLDAAVAVALDGDPARRERLVGSERVTAEA
ncbi:TIGR03089 family protein [Pengzhenrongella frigida]|uniref:TIGR03089 family protein n=1 Tax=Pengzhenrongella frigida TaxID=1259133 RepID=A0A4Q5N049_9MICO|nr:TIGR03089 family protein [Cellulomonas sp. HLT2-17]RYV51390.1 TIGR03089 family protein [Cellulomonas sp. HLT2-17]